MPSSKNASIGTCPCPFKGCEAVTAVYKFRGRSDNPARHRYAGRLYCQCPTHGRIESQEWILENARIDTAAVTTAAPVADESAASTARSQKATPTSAGAVATDRRPAGAPPKATPASTPAARSVTTAPATERARERWGFFD